MFYIPQFFSLFLHFSGNIVSTKKYVKYFSIGPQIILLVIWFFDWQIFSMLTMLPRQYVFQTKIIILLERLQTEPIFKKEKQDDGLFSCFSPLFLNILSFFEKIYCLLWWRDARINNNTLWLRLYHSVEIEW